MNILALDLGKHNTVFCDYDVDSGQHEFGKVKTTPQGIHDLLVDREPGRVVMEICAIAGWVVDIARVLGIETEVAKIPLTMPGGGRMFVTRMTGKMPSNWPSSRRCAKFRRSTCPPRTCAKSDV